MNPSHIFISHASKDDDFVKQLRIALESHQLSVWVDSRNLRGGAKLAPEIEQAIETARQIIVVLSPNTINSPWVLREIAKAVDVEKRRGGEGYRVIPLLLPGVEPSALALWFGEEPAGIRVELKAGSVSEALPNILAALGERSPDDHQLQQTTPSNPVEELILKLNEPRIETRDGKRRAKAKAQLIYQPADQAARKVESNAYYFTAPLGPIEAPSWQEDLRWYLEQFYLWPAGVFAERAQAIEEKLPQWGQELFQAAASNAPAQAALNAPARAALNEWMQTGDQAERRFFVAAFYRSLAEGKRVGAAMLAGQRALHGDTWRGKVMGAGDLCLQDWFVPVLYQEEQDPLLITRRPSKAAQQVQQKPRQIRLGALPDEPPHSFIGRSRELLALERLLDDDQQRYAVVRGVGGQGKTTLAAELARWLVRTSRFKRAAFVSLGQYTDARGVLDALGRQLLPEGDKWSVAHFPNLQQALQPVERALRDHSTIIVLDNLESVLPSNYGVQSTGFSRNASDAEPLPAEAGTLNAVSEGGDANDAAIAEIFNLCRDLLLADPTTRLLFTTREPLPAPFDHRHREITLGALSREDAIELVSQVMAREGLTPKADDPGGDPREITDLVEAVNRHARALTLLAREVARRGVRATTENLHQLMAELDRKHPGDRENSLHASVELSLRRLLPELREPCRMLGVFHGGAHLVVLAMMLKENVEAAKNLADALVEVGLGEAMGYGHLRLDPSLPAYLLGQMNTSEKEILQSSWAAGMQALTVFLYQQRLQNTQLAAQLTLLELANLLALLTWAEGALKPEEIVDVACRLEELLARLGRSQVLAQVVKTREEAARKLEDWSHAQFEALRSSVDRLLEQGKMSAAYTAAQKLLHCSLSGGERAYEEAIYDIALAHLTLGHVLKKSGAVEAALLPLAEAQRRFQMLADLGNANAERSASSAITEIASSLLYLGRYGEAAAAYEEGIRRDEKLADLRGVAVGKGQLGTVRLFQKRYAEALEIYAEARKTFEVLGEPGSVAVFWHQTGVVCREAGLFERAENAYRQALAIKVQQKNIAGEASSLAELGNLYNQMERLEEAVRCYRLAADIYVKLQDQRNEGFTHGNLADVFIKLQHYDEARRELLRAIECLAPYGHAAQSWRIWEILRDLEQITGRPQAAAEAWQQAVQSYLAYRRDGGQSMNRGAQLCAFAAQSIAQGVITELEQNLTEFLGADISSDAKALILKLLAILRGDRDPALATDPELDYDDAVELKLLLEALGTN